MRLVVADTSPLRHLVQIDQVELLPRLFEKMFIPSIVFDELRHSSAPESVRNWMNSIPDGLEVRAVRASDNTVHLRILMTFLMSIGGNGLSCRGRRGKLLILRWTPRRLRRLRLGTNH